MGYKERWWTFDTLSKKTMMFNYIIQRVKHFCVTLNIAV